MVYGGSYLYAFRGGGSSTFWRYSISGNSWSSRANALSGVYGGGALTYSGSEQWSDAYATVTATTSPTPTPTPTPTVTPSATVGGKVFHINKLQVLAPWLGAFLALLLLIGGTAVKLVSIRRKAG